MSLYILLFQERKLIMIQRRIMSHNQIMSAVCFIFQYHAIVVIRACNEIEGVYGKNETWWISIDTFDPLRNLYLSCSFYLREISHNAFSHDEKSFLVLFLDISYQDRILKFPVLSSSRRRCRFTHNCWYVWAVWSFHYSIFLDDSWKQQQWTQVAITSFHSAERIY